MEVRHDLIGDAGRFWLEKRLRQSRDEKAQILLAEAQDKVRELLAATQAGTEERSLAQEFLDFN